MLGRGAACRGSRLLPVAASGAPAFAQYKPAPGGGYTPWALLVLGTSFVFVSMFSMVMHAQRVLHHVWPWWAFGIGLGIAILVLFALFEKKRDEMLELVQRVRQWE